MSVTIRIGIWARRYIANESLQLKLSGDTVVSDALTELEIPPDEIGVVLLNGKAVQRSTALNDGDVLEVLPLLIGG